MCVCAYIDQAMSLYNELLPVWYSKDLKHVSKEHCLYRIVYSLIPGVQVYVIIGDARYKCSRHRKTFSDYCKEYDKNVKYYKFDVKKRVWKHHGGLGDYLKNIEDWIIPFDIRLIDICTRNRYHYGYGDGIRVYHWEEKKREKKPIVVVDQRTKNWKYRKHAIRQYGSESFLEDM